MVNIHLRKTDGEWVHALAIPLDDIGRLILRPLKWLRVATFAVIGPEGHLSDTSGGNAIDYKNVSLTDLTNNPERGRWTRHFHSRPYCPQV